MRISVVTTSRIDPRKPRALGFVRALVAGGHQVSVVAISDHSLSGRAHLDAGDGGLAELGVRTDDVAFAPGRGALARAALATATMRVTSDVALYRDEDLGRRVRSAVSAQRPDVVHADRSRVLQLLEGLAVPAVVDLTDPRSLFFEQYRASIRRHLGRLGVQELVRATLDVRAARIEERTLPARAIVLVASEAGRAVMVAGGAPPDRVLVVPNPVEAADRVDPDPARRGGAVALTGNLSYPPNVLAAHDFVERTWPAVAAANPGAALELIGATPRPSLRALAERGDVTLVPDVADMGSTLRGIGVGVAPHLVCGGFPNRVVDTVFKAGRPIVVSDVIARMAVPEVAALLPAAAGPDEWAEEVRRARAGGEEVAARVRALQDELLVRCGVDAVAAGLEAAYRSALGGVDAR